MNTNYSIGQQFNYSITTNELGPLTIKGGIIYNNGALAVVKISLMNDELFTMTFSHWQVQNIIPGFNDPACNDKPLQSYAIIDAQTGEFAFSSDPETDELIDLRD